jgi:uncharacterized protein YpmB
VIQTDPVNNRKLEVIMKSLLSAVVLASALIVPAVSFAQANAPVTRAQVRAELVAAQKAGLVYQNDTEYPKAVPQSTTVGAAPVESSQDVGGVNVGSSDAGSRSSVQQRLFSTYRGQ